MIYALPLLVFLFVEISAGSVGGADTSKAKQDGVNNEVSFVSRLSSQLASVLPGSLLEKSPSDSTLDDPMATAELGLSATTRPSIDNSVAVSIIDLTEIYHTVSLEPSSIPSDSPSVLPSSKPSGIPSTLPSVEPSDLPSVSFEPSSEPSDQPTLSLEPSGMPSISPSATPTSTPSGTPSADPSSDPSSGPSSQPSSHPSRIPSSPPSSAPSLEPSADPSNAPTEFEALRVVKEVGVLVQQILQGTLPSLFSQNSQLEASAKNLASAANELDQWMESGKTDTSSLEKAKGQVNAAYSKLCKTTTTTTTTTAANTKNKGKKDRNLQEEKEEYCSLILLALEDIQLDLNASR